MRALSGAFAPHDSAQMAAAVLVEVFALEPVAQIGPAGKIEGRRELRAFAAVAHLRRIRATAREQQQRIDEQRFARAGLAGDHGHARAEGDFRFADDREVLDVKGFQHGVDNCSARQRVPER